jgi:hypothetical protein
MPKLVDLTGKKFGRWLVIKRDGENAHGSPTWLVRCECGTEKIVNGMALRQGASKSCGCYNRDVRREINMSRSTHKSARRGARSKAYATWVNMKSRCNNPNASGFHKYGAKGIKVCDRWDTFENFLADMGEPPSSAHTLDRIDPKGYYTPNNCRWATQKEQQNNRSNNHLITHQGTTKTLMQWSECLGVPHKTLHYRLKNWTLEKALTPRK